MRKITFILVLSLVSLVGRAAGPTLPYDHSVFFATSAINSNGTSLETGNAAAALAWNAGTTAGAASPIIQSNTLTYTSGSAYVDNSPSGKEIVLPSDAAAEHRSVFYLATSTSTYTVGTYYLSAIINVSAATTSKLLLAFEKLSTGTTQRGRVYIKSSGSGFALSTGVSGNTSAVSSDLALNTNHLIVLKYVITATTADVSLFINPTIGGSEGSATLTGTQLVSSGEYIRGITLFQNAGLGAKIAGLRFSTSWADATKAAAVASPLSTPSNITSTDITTTGFTANWDAVTNASSYSVKTYHGTSLISTISVPSGTSTAVTGLMSGLNYSYKVTAIGNGTTYSDSPESGAVNVQTSGSVSAINSDFSTGFTTAAAYSTGLFPTYTENGFDFTAASLLANTKTGLRAETHVNYVNIDKLIYNGSLTLPTVSSLEQIEIHAGTGTAGRTFTLQEYVNGAWSTLTTFTTNAVTSNLDEIFLFNISRASATKLRIANAGNGGMYVYQVITRSTTPTMLTAPTVGTASNIKATTGTANWTALANASSYTVRVYLQRHDNVGALTGSTSLKFTGSAAGAAATSLSFTGLQADSTYKYTVQAIGDGNVSFSDSYLSASSESFVTAHQINISSTSNASSVLAGITANDDVLVGSGGTLNLDASISLNKITVAAGGKLTLADTKSITANSVILQSNVDGTASFVDENAAGATITATVQQYITSGRNWYMTTPIASATGANLLTNAGSVVSYNEATEAWDPVVSGTALDPMRGYISAATATTGAVSYTGVLNTGEKFLDLTRTSTTTKPGFNLVGNPFPSFVNWESATKMNLETTMWYRSRNAGNTAYIFDTYNATTHAGTGNNGTTVTTNIPPMQAFWVRVAAGNTTGRLTLNNTMRSHGSGTERMKAPKTNDQQLLRLQVSNGTNSDEAIVVFNANASNNLDAFDSYKMSNNNIAVPEIYTLTANEELVINGFNTNSLQTEIPLGFRTGALSSFSIKATEATNFKSDTRIILKDNVLNKQTDLTDGSQYTFSSDVANTTGRFSILFKSAGATTDVDNTNSNLTNLVFVNNNGQIVVQNTTGLLRSISIYNSIGQLVEKNSSLNSTITSSKLNTGVYFVHLQNENNTHTVCKVKVD